MGVALGGGEAHRNHPADKIRGAVEVDDAVPTGAAEQLAGALATGAFDQDRDHTPQIRLPIVATDLFLTGDQALETGLVVRFRRCILKAGGGRLGPGRIEKGIDFGEPGLFQQIHGLCEILGRFPGKADDDIRGNADIRTSPPQAGHPFEVLVPSIAAPHGGQDAIGAGLHRQVDMIAELGQITEAIDEFIGQILGMGGDETHPLQPGDVFDPAQQFGERDLPRFFTTVGIDVLTNEGNFAHTLFDQLHYLGQNFAVGAADLAAAHVGHDAVAAEIVATLNDRDETGDAVRGNAPRK